MIKPFSILIALAGLVLATEADAQLFVRARSTPVTYSRGYSSPAATVNGPTRLYHYSYYANSTLPARTYVGYGSNDFPFHGTPYGYPYDPWTWPMMSGSYASGLARSYDSPIK